MRSKSDDRLCTSSNSRWVTPAVQTNAVPNVIPPPTPTLSSHKQPMLPTANDNAVRPTPPTLSRRQRQPCPTNTANIIPPMTLLFHRLLILFILLHVDLSLDIFTFPLWQNCSSEMNTWLAIKGISKYIISWHAILFSYKGNRIYVINSR